MDHEQRKRPVYGGSGDCPDCKGTGNGGGHSDASDHCFELKYLAHIYNRAYISAANETDGVHAFPDLKMKGRVIVRHLRARVGARSTRGL